jgi:glycosyltransferase involved in cell wall biosynthesis
MTDTNTLNSDVYWNNRFAENWEACEGPRQSRFFARIAVEHLPRWLIEQLKRQSLTLADWGCAQGDGTDVWAAYIDAKQITGIDFSSVAVEQAVQRYPSIRFINEDWLAENDDQQSRFDVVFSSNTLEHFHKPYDALHAICMRANKAFVLALPYKELERIDEHFFSFLPENIPTVLRNGFRLVWSQVVDCRQFPNTLWGGDQIILVFADPKWIDTLHLTLSDCRIDQTDTATVIDRLKDLLAKRDGQIASLHQAVIERDGWLAEYSNQVDAFKNSRSWRITAPLRRLGLLLGGRAIQEETLPSNTDHRRNLSNIQCNGGVGVWRRRLAYLSSRYQQGVKRHGLLRSLPFAIRASSVLMSAWLNKRFRHRTYDRKLQQLRNIIIGHNGFIDFFHVPMGWSTPLFQRFQHMSLQAAQLGGLALYGGHLQVDKDLFVFKRAEGNVIVFDALDEQVVQCVFHALKEVRHPKILRLQSIDLATRVEDVERFLNEGLTVVYEYIDEISVEITGSIPEFVIERHKWLIQDQRILVVATADKLFNEVCKHRDSGCILSTNGVDLAHWRKPIDHPPIDMEPALASGRTVVGYHGALANWIDYELLRQIADDGGYELVLIGYEHDSSMANSGILEHPNVHFLGSKSYFVLNEYAAYYDVGILPFKRYALTESVSPVKLFEYMAAGKPVVTTDLFECSKYESCLVSDSHASFLKNLRAATAAKNDETYKAILRADAERNSWLKKAASVLRLAGVGIAS